MARKVPIESAHRLALKAMSSPTAKRTGMSTLEWDVSGRCESPRKAVIEGRPDRDTDQGYGWAPGKLGPIWIEMEIPCRRCPACLRARANLWRHRARAEIQGAQRTWFGTMTLSPERHQHWLNVCRHRCRTEKGVDYDTLSKLEQFQRRCWAISPELTKWLKRVRKNSGANMRFMLVAEAHKSGLPHFHGLFHEGVGPALLHRHLYDAWNQGLVRSFKLVAEDDEGAEYYVTKYLNKSSLARVRASLDYGSSFPSERIVSFSNEVKKCSNVITSDLPSPQPPGGNGGTTQTNPPRS